MNYPTMEEVETAGRERLARWNRFLPGPGSSAVGASDAKFEALLGKEVIILNRILARFKELGGMNPTISKKIGWS